MGFAVRLLVLCALFPVVDIYLLVSDSVQKEFELLRGEKSLKEIGFDELIELRNY